MKFTDKEYKIQKIQDYIKQDKLLFISTGVNKNSNEWLHVKQNLKKINLNFYKVSNKLAINIIKKSIYKNFKTAIQSTVFFLKTPRKNLIRQILLESVKLLLFDIIIIKLNKTMYQFIEFKKQYSLNYKSSKLLMFQFGIHFLKKKSK